MQSRTGSSNSRPRESVSMVEPLESRELFSVSMLAGVDSPTATSSHPGGMNVVMGDGSVRFLSSGISTATR